MAFEIVITIYGVRCNRIMISASSIYVQVRLLPYLVGLVIAANYIARAVSGIISRFAKKSF